MSFLKTFVVFKSNVRGLFVSVGWGSSRTVWTLQLRGQLQVFFAHFLDKLPCLGTVVFFGPRRPEQWGHCAVSMARFTLSVLAFLLCKPYKGRGHVMKMCFGSLYWKKMERHVRKSQSEESWLKAPGSQRSRRTGRQTFLVPRHAFFLNTEHQQQQHYTICI